MTVRSRPAARGSEARAAAGGPTLTADDGVAAAVAIVERDGADALTMRRLSDDLAVAVTSIYWHVGNRQDLLDAVVDRQLADMGTLHARGATPRARIGSLARQLRAQLLERPNLVALVHEQSKTSSMFRPAQTAMASQLAALGVHGEAAALALRDLQVHVVASVLLERSIERYPRGAPAPVGEGGAIGRAVHDAELAAALDREPDRVELFTFGLDALLDAIIREVPTASA